MLVPSPTPRDGDLMMCVASAFRAFKAPQVAAILASAEIYHLLRHYFSILNWVCESLGAKADWLVPGHSATVLWTTMGG